MRFGHESYYSKRETSHTRHSPDGARGMGCLSYFTDKQIAITILCLVKLSTALFQQSLIVLLIAQGKAKIRQHCGDITIVG